MSSYPLDAPYDILYILDIMQEQMIIRIDSDLKKKAGSLARSEGKNMSQVMRELLSHYIEERDIGSYVDDLWSRIGQKLKAKGVRAKDVSRAIREARR